MRELRSATDLVAPGETALFLYTDGRFFHVAADNTAESGNWVLDPERPVDWVCVLRRHGHKRVPCDVWRGRPAGFRGPIEDRRWVLRIANVELVGHTMLNWREFVGGSSNPVRYVSV